MHGLGNSEHLSFVVRTANGQQITVNPGVSPMRRHGVPRHRRGFAAERKGPEAIQRHGEAVWTRLDAATHTFLVSYNDYGGSLAAAIALLEIEGPLRVSLLDMRYLQANEVGGTR